MIQTVSVMSSESDPAAEAEAFHAAVRRVVDHPFESKAEAGAATHATLEALGESIAEGEAEAAAEELPREAAEHLLAGASGDASPLDYHEFLNRVGAAIDADHGVAQARAQAVLAALDAEISEFESESIAGQLPEQWDPVLNTAAATQERDFLDRVAASADLDDEAARDAAKATLDVLGDRLTRGEAARLAAYMPAEAQSWLLPEASEPAEAFSVEEFVDRVASDLGVNHDTARERIRAVTEALDGLGAHDELNTAENQLPEEYYVLFP